MDPVTEAIRQLVTTRSRIERMLKETTHYHPDRRKVLVEAGALVSGVIERTAPVESAYFRQAERIIDRFSRRVDSENAIDELLGIVRALEFDYQQGNLRHIEEMARTAVFTDFLNLALYLLETEAPAPAALIAGSVLEEHIVKLAKKYSISIVRDDGQRKKVEALNADLATKAYSRTDQKHVTAWYGMRNDAAHNSRSLSSKEVEPMITGVAAFIERNPA